MGYSYYYTPLFDALCLCKQIASLEILFGMSVAPADFSCKERAETYLQYVLENKEMKNDLICGNSNLNPSNKIVI